MLGRLRALLGGCVTASAHRDPQDRRAVPRELQVRGHAAEAVFIEQMARAGSEAGADRHS